MRPAHAQRPLAVFAMGALALLAATSSDLIAAQRQGGTQGQAQGQTQGQTQGPGRTGGEPPQTQRDQRQVDRQTRDAAQQQAQIGTGTIAGFVTVDGASSPVRRARVNLTGPEVRPGRSTVTDDKGYFALTSLPAGRFTLTVSKPGFVNIAYGAKKPGRPGTAIQLSEGQKIDRANVALPKGAVVTGIVIDEFGEPSPRTQVRVMRFVTRTGEKALEQADQAQTDDRGMYRVWGLQPGDYLVSAVPRNQNFGDALQIASDTMESLLQQGRGGGPGRGAMPLNAGRGLVQRIEDVAARQQQLAQAQQQQQPVAYAPVYYPGTTSSTSATPVTLNVGEERSGVDFQLQLVQTTTVSGTITSADGNIPQRIQISLVAQTSGPEVPGLGNNSSRVERDGKFTFSNVTPGQYTVTARAIVQPPASATSTTDPQVAGGRGGRGGQGGFGPGPGGRGGPQQVLWASADVSVNGQSAPEVSLNLQAGMTVSGRITFDSTSQTPPTDLTRTRIALTTRGQQTFDMGPMPPAQVDANGNFKIIGVPPGRYLLTGNVPVGGVTQTTDAAGSAATGGAGGRGGRGGGGGAVLQPGSGGGWILKSAIVNGRDTLDFPFDLHPNEEIAGAQLTFTDVSQEVSGTLQDSAGLPTSEYTIIVFAADKQFWTPQSRRIVSARPDTAGKFTVRGLPAGNYRVTAVTDVEQGEWFDPSFLQQLIGVSVPFSLAPGQKQTQDLRVAGGGH